MSAQPESCSVTSARRQRQVALHDVNVDTGATYSTTATWSARTGAPGGCAGGRGSRSATGRGPGACRCTSTQPPTARQQDGAGLDQLRPRLPRARVVPRTHVRCDGRHGRRSACTLPRCSGPESAAFGAAARAQGRGKPGARYGHNQEARRAAGSTRALSMASSRADARPARRLRSHSASPSARRPGSRRRRNSVSSVNRSG